MSEFPLPEKVLRELERLQTEHRQEALDSFFISEERDGRVISRLNPDCKLDLQGQQEQARYLAELLRSSIEKMHFCSDTQTWGRKEGEDKPSRLPEDEWYFEYKTPSQATCCEFTQQMLDKIFGDHHQFNRLPFVMHQGSRVYGFKMNQLKYFAEHGLEATKELIAQQQLEETQARLREQAEQHKKFQLEQDKKLTERFGWTSLSPALREQINSYAGERSLVVTGPNLAAVITSRSEYGSSDCIAYWSQVQILYGNQKQMREWCWRDRGGNIRDYVFIHEIQSLVATQVGNKIIVRAKLASHNDERTNTRVRWEEFTFDALPEDIDKPQDRKPEISLSQEEQAKFLIETQQAMNKTMEHKEELYQLKPKMAADTPGWGARYVPYLPPTIVQTSIHPERGIAVWVIEEQIDHNVRDRQMHRELFVLRFGQPEATYIAEHHAYQSQGGAFLTVLEVSNHEISINTSVGKRTIIFKRS